MKVGCHNIDVIYVVVAINFIAAVYLISFGTLYSTSRFLVGLRNAPSGGNFNVLDFVDPLIGTQNQGHVFPGASLPFAMAKAGADVRNRNDGQGGFVSDNSPITGFSHLHDSGTGSAPSLGNFPIFPYLGCYNDSVSNCLFSRDERATPRLNGTVVAHPGYFSITMNNSIKAEMTVTNHTALYRFTFPSYKSGLRNTSLPYYPLISVDLIDLQNSIAHGRIAADNSTGRLSGSGTFNPAFGIGTYNLSFCIDFSGPSLRNTGLWKNVPYVVSFDGAWAQFHPPPNDQILVRVGVSFMSTSKACENAESEIPLFDFEEVSSAAREIWKEKLSVIQIDPKDVSIDIQKLFWSGVYRSMISPQDYSGENPLWNSSEPYYDSYFCIWDTFRTTHPLLTILDPESQARMVRSLIDIYRFEGKLPDCRMSLCKGFTQGGSNADIVIADALLKNITDGIDWAVAYQAVLSDAEIQPQDWTEIGRGSLANWKTIGYIPYDDRDDWDGALLTRSISRTVEYAYDDFCISLMAKELDHDKDSEKYMHRSQNWENLFNPTQVSLLNTTTNTLDTGFVGFLQPRLTNGTFTYQDPALCSPLLDPGSCSLDYGGHETYEGSSWLYTFFVPQDMASLIHRLGGPEVFTSRLMYFHTSGLLDMGNEQAFLPIYQFHYAGRPGLSAYFAHYYIPSQFNTTLGGIPGNDDSGATGSFTALAMMGLWPVAGQNVYLITPPFFREVRVTNKQSGKIATMKCHNFDSKYKNIYIQSVRLNGKTWEKNWITHNFWIEGGVLELVLGEKESKWGTREKDLPPSSSTTEKS